MKTLRYLLSLIAILSVVSVSAATFGKPYRSQYHRQTYITQTGAQMPTATMSALDAAMMKSGSALPMAAVSGTTTASDNAPGGPRRAKKEGNPFDGAGTAGDIGNPLEPAQPLGDAVLPLLLCAAVFCGVIAIRRKRSALNR